MRERLGEAENGITNLIEEILTKDKATTPPQDQEPLSLSMLAAAPPNDWKLWGSHLGGSGCSESAN